MPSIVCIRQSHVAILNHQLLVYIFSGSDSGSLHLLRWRVLAEGCVPLAQATEAEAAEHEAAARAAFERREAVSAAAARAQAEAVRAPSELEATLW